MLDEQIIWNLESVDEEFTILSFTEIYDSVTEAATQFLRRPNENSQLADLVLSSLEMLLLLCYKWLRSSKKINNEDRKWIKQYQPKLLELRDDVYMFIQFMEKEPPTSIHYIGPQTKDPELLALMREIDWPVDEEVRIINGQQLPEIDDPLVRFEPEPSMFDSLIDYTPPRTKDPELLALMREIDWPVEG